MTTGVIDIHDMDDCDIVTQERAAIMEFCGGMTRAEANKKARAIKTGVQSWLFGVEPPLGVRTSEAPARRGNRGTK